MGNRLKELRDGKYTQDQISKLLNVGRSTYTKYESGAITMNEDILSRLSEIYDVSIDYILGRSDEQRIEPAISANTYTTDADSDSDQELWELREAIRRNPELRTLFKLSKGATKQELRQMEAIIRALRTSNDYEGIDTP